jgi:predicted ATPase
MGKFEISINGKLLPAYLWRKQKVAALLKCLLLAPDFRLNRQKAIDWLWGDLDGDAAVNNLRVSLHHLRKITMPYLQPSTSLLVSTESGITFSPDILVNVDLNTFENAIQHALAHNLEGAELALNLYKGELLPEDLDYNWIEERREKLRRQALLLARQYVQRTRANGKLRQTERILNAILEHDPYDERALVELMRLLGATGRRGDGLKLYQQFAERLRRDVGVSPESTTRAAYEHLLKSEAVASQVYPAKERVRAAKSVTRGTLLGRENELEKAANLIEAARQGESHLLLIGGEVGIGKTRLAEEIAGRATAAGLEVAWGRCYEQDNHIPFMPFVEAARQIIEFLPPNYLKNRLGHQAGWLLPLLPELATKITGLNPPEAAPAEKEQARQRDAFIHLFEAASLHNPLLLVLEDWQWVDSETSALLQYFVRRAVDKELAVLIVCTYRSDETDQIARDMSSEMTGLVRQQIAQKIVLAGLNRSQTQILMHRILNTPLTAPLLETVYQQTGGNPFFLEELAKLLKEKSGQTTNFEQWALPDTVRETIARRLTNLSEETLRLLRAAAVLGGEFEAGRLQKVAGLEDEELLDALDEAVAAQVLLELPGTNSEILRFKHALMRKYLYDNLSHLRRTKIHSRAGAVLEEEAQTGMPVNLAEIAAQYQAGQEYDKAIYYYTEAGRRAAQLSANSTAVDYFKQALALVDYGAQNEQKVSRRVELGVQWVRSACFSSSLAENEQRLFELEHLVMENLLVESRRDEHLAEIYYWFGRIYFVAGYIDKAIYYSEKSLALAGENSPTGVQALSALGRALALHGDSARAIEILERAGKLCENIGNLFEASYCYGVLGDVYWNTGNGERSMFFCDLCLELALKLGNPSRIGAAYYYRCLPLIEGGKWEEGLAAAQKCLEIGRNLGENYYVSLAEVYIGYALYFGGKSQEAIFHLKKSLELASEVGLYLVSSRARSYLAEIYLSLGNYDLAQQEAEQVLKESEMGIRWGEGMALFVLGEVWLKRNPANFAKAEHYLQEAVKVMGEQGTKGARTRIQTMLSTLSSRLAVEV